MRSKAGRRAWVSYATGLEVFNIAITFTVFGPYFIANAAATPAAGQALWGYAAGLGGLLGLAVSSRTGRGGGSSARLPGVRQGRLCPRVLSATRDLPGCRCGVIR